MDHLFIKRFFTESNASTADSATYSSSSSCSSRCSEVSSVGEVNEELAANPWNGEGYVAGVQKTFFLFTMGTRGDVQPLVQIGKRLAKDGHFVRVCCHKEHQDLVEKQGLEWFELKGFPPSELMKESIEGGLLSVIKMLKKKPMFTQWYREMYQSTWESINAPSLSGEEFKADAIISCYTCFNALDVAEKLKIPLFLVNPFPTYPTKEFRHPYPLIMEGHAHGSEFGNKMSFFMNESMMELGLRSIQKECRKYLGLPKLKAGSRTMSGRRLSLMKVPCFGVWSSNILSEPEDYPENYKVVGSLNLSGGLGEGLPEDVMNYIKSCEDSDNEKPLFIGFGSMTHEEQLEKAWSSCLSALKELRIKNCILQVSKFDKKFVVGNAPKGAFILEKPVNHSVLFANVRAVVHHGGAGTVNAGCRAGVPNCVISFGVDQPFWGDLLAERKHVGSHCRAFYATTTEVKKCFRKLAHKEIVYNAKKLAKRMKEEADGLDVFCEELYKHFPGQPVEYLKMEKRALEEQGFALF